MHSNSVEGIRPVSSRALRLRSTAVAAMALPSSGPAFWLAPMSEFGLLLGDAVFVFGRGRSVCLWHIDCRLLIVGGNVKNCRSPSSQAGRACVDGIESFGVWEMVGVDLT